MDNTMTAKTCGVKHFITIQRLASDCNDLAKKLNAEGYETTSSKCRARIKWLCKRGYTSMLRPYNDLKGNRGRKTIEQQLKGLMPYLAGK